MLSCLSEDCLKLICTLGGEDANARNRALATRLGVPSGTITTVLKRLSAAGLLEHVPYRGAHLTTEGARVAGRLLRRQRVLELFLVRMLGYTWDQVPEEADRLEHGVSHEFIDRLAAVLGNPASDPHGAPIPPPGSSYVESAFPCLADLAAGQRGIIRRVTEEDGELLRYLAGLGLVPGAEIEVVAREPFNGPLRVRCRSREVFLGAPVAGWLMIEPLRESSAKEGQHV